MDLFRDAPDAFIRMLSACLHQIHFVPGDYIIQQGDLVPEMYFLHRGEAVEVEAGVEIGVIRHGSHINWQAVLLDWPASALFAQRTTVKFTSSHVMTWMRYQHVSYSLFLPCLVL